MSAVKRSHRRQTDAPSAVSPPASKRQKTAKSSSHTPAQSGLDFLVDDNARHGKKIDAKLTNGVSKSKTNRVDESNAAMGGDDVGEGKAGFGSSQKTAIDISSAEADSDDSDSEEEGKIDIKALTNGHTTAGAEDTTMADADAPSSREASPEPSFADMLQARHPDPIDVTATLPDLMADRKALQAPNTTSTALAAPSGTSLTTALTQALKTNDKALLESCFRTTDLPTIRATVQRLPSRHVATLLARLAERIHLRPGRPGPLLAWVQWALVAHGGYLASNPSAMHQLQSLNAVVRERAQGLQPLLHLKGKLDLLAAQLELRRNAQALARVRDGAGADEPGVVYVEGGNGAEDRQFWEAGGSTSTRTGIARAPRTDGSDAESDAESDAGGMPNGAAQEADDSDAEESEQGDGEGGVLDLEAEESDDDEDEDEEDDEEGDSASGSEGDDDSDGSEAEDDESEVEGVKPVDVAQLRRKR